MTISYRIHSCSEPPSPIYGPENIITDSPKDQSSRYTTAPGSLDGKESIDSYSSRSRLLDGDARSAGSAGFIILELERAAVIEKIGFGKFHKVHACNLNEFSVYGGMDVENLVLLNHNHLLNDTVPQEFELPSRNTDLKQSPIKFLKIVAWSGHTKNFNISIWHVYLLGYDEPTLLEPILYQFNLYRQTKTSHLLLSHLRRQQLLSSFIELKNSLPASIVESFEHPILTQLHQLLVQSSQTSTAEAEELIGDAAQLGLLSESTLNIPSTAHWSLLHSSATATNQQPSKRSGHHLVYLPTENCLLLFGGFDGTNSLNDLWKYYLDSPEEREGWRYLLHFDPDQSNRIGWNAGKNTNEATKASRPTGRSCGQFVLDESTGFIYLLGGLAPSATPSATGMRAIFEPSSRRRSVVRDLAPEEMDSGSMDSSSSSEDPLSLLSTHEGVTYVERNLEQEKKKVGIKSDFWKYKAWGEGSGEWTLISSDTEAEGGPKLIHDHQIVVSSDLQHIFVFGGRIIKSEKKETDKAEYSGFYSYNIGNNTWSLIFEDSKEKFNVSGVAPGTNSRYEPVSEPVKKESSITSLNSRVGHSMFIASSFAKGEGENGEKKKKLYILGGQRNDVYLSDLYSIALPTSSTFLSLEIPKLEKVLGGPPESFTSRVLIDSFSKSGADEADNWTMISGLTKDTSYRSSANATATEKIINQIYRFRGGKQWSIVRDGELPIGRYASQIVKDIKGNYYCFGGRSIINQSFGAGTEGLMNDLWKLNIVDPTTKDIIRKAKFLIRKLKFQDLCQFAPSNSSLALNYLQKDLGEECVDQERPEEVEALKACLISLLSSHNESQGDRDMDGMDEYENESEAIIKFEAVSRNYSETETGSRDLFEKRTKVWGEILQLFNADCKEPAGDLLNLALRL